jgi:tetratricopeptide (TPR) repeat protein
LKKKSLIAFFVMLNFACLLNSEAPATNPKWNQQMQQLRAVLAELLPDVFSDERFNSPQNYKRIEMNVKKLADLAHDMPGADSHDSKMAGPPDQDRSILLISGYFKAEVQGAYNNLLGGRRLFARAVLKSVPSFCIACHTRSTAPDLSPLQLEAPKDLRPIERAQFFDATRQFDRALDEFEKVLADPTAARDHFLDWETAAHYGIATAVRVKQDPDRALRLVSHVTAAPAAPIFFKEQATQWARSLQEWKKEQPQKLETAEALLARAKALIGTGKNIQQYPLDESADILYLRASAILHDYLGRYPSNPNAGEALLLLGTCYEILQNVQLWALHDLYYEACVQQFPHTPIAGSCYQRYEQSIYVGYSGSGGFHLPPEIKDHLIELKKLAEPAAANPH